MKKNKLLNIAVVICKSIRVFYILIFLVLTVLFIHLQVSPDFYEETNFDYKNSSSFMIFKSTSWKAHNPYGIALEDKEVFKLNKISVASLYINYLKLCATLIFIFLATKEFQKVIQSVKNLKTFQSNNVASFRKMGKYIFVIFLLASFTNIQFEQGGKNVMHIELTSLFLMLIAFIMAEIFKEGNLLQQENDLTI